MSAVPCFHREGPILFDSRPQDLSRNCWPPPDFTRCRSPLKICAGPGRETLKKFSNTCAPCQLHSGRCWNECGFGAKVLANYALALQRFDEARQIIHEAQARKADGFLMHNALYALAFLAADTAAMAEQQQWFAGKPEENFGLSLSSDTEAYGG